MQLFTRTIHLAGPPADTMTYATEICAMVNQKIGREIALWSALFGAPIGSMSFAMRVEGVADLSEATAGLRADQEYLAKVGTGSQYHSGPAEDWLGLPVHGELGDASPPIGSCAAITTAQIANGRYVDAFGWGIDVAKHVESVTGVGTMVLASEYGPFGTITWIGVTADATGVDAANAALMANEDYVKMLGAASDLFVAGSGHRTLATRIA